MKKLRQLFDVRSGELKPALLMFGFFFSIIAVFQILKPLKKGLFVSHFGAEQELIAKGINIDVAFSAMIGFTYLYNWLGGRRLVRFLCGFFSIALLIFYAVVTDAPSGFVNYAFYLFGDLEHRLGGNVLGSPQRDFNGRAVSAAVRIDWNWRPAGRNRRFCIGQRNSQDLQLRAPPPALSRVDWGDFHSFRAH